MATNGDNQTATAKKTEKGKKLEKIHTHRCLQQLAAAT